MTDRELLELAAKAAGCGPSHYEDGSWLEVRYGYTVALWFDERDGYWNPLECDGDAFRLAVDLGLLVCAYDDESWAQWYIKPYGRWITTKEARGEDPYAATRRAIVRCAAKIGKGMP